jgi:hypothetical protein
LCPLLVDWNTKAEKEDAEVMGKKIQLSLVEASEDVAVGAPKFHRSTSYEQ